MKESKSLKKWLRQGVNRDAEPPQEMQDKGCVTEFRLSTTVAVVEKPTQTIAFAN